jgi:DNA (cytosine-5)-methyltransferase 1
MNELALFAGAGGGILGGSLLGWRTVAAVEIEDYPRRVLLQRQADGILPRFPIWDDVQTFDGKPWRGKVDVISGGFPCQDISCAGKGAGIDGERSGMWGHMARIVGEVRPRFVFVENSPLLVGRGLAVVLGDLAEMGYDVRWCVLGADDAGAPHKRKRLWLLAYPHSCGGIKNPGVCELRANRTKQSPANQRESYAPEDAEKWWFKDPADIPNADKMRLQGSGKKQDSGNAGLPFKSVRSDRERPEAKRTPTTEPELGRVAHGVAHRVDRLKAIGNGQVPAVAALAWQILNTENDESSGKRSDKEQA